MSTIEEDLLLDAEMDAQKVAFIQQCLTEQGHTGIEEDDLYYFIDLLASYYAESSILDIEPDKDGFVDIPVDAIVEYAQNAARKEINKDFSDEVLSTIIEADLDFEEAAGNE